MDYSIAEHLISLGANINDVSQNDFMVAPLHSAVSSQDFDITRLLLVNGANPNLAQTKGIRPIHQAAHAGNKSMLELLLKHGADPNLVTDEGKNAIDFAKEVNADEIIRILTSR